MTPPYARFDPGLQPERTALAWRRTALSVTITSVVAVRIMPAALGHPIWYAPGVLGLAFAAWMWWTTPHRLQTFVDQISATKNEASPHDARPLLVVIGFVTLAGTGAFFTALLAAG